MTNHKRDERIKFLIECIPYLLIIAVVLMGYYVDMGWRPEKSIRNTHAIHMGVPGK